MKAFARFLSVLSLTAFCAACGGGGGGSGGAASLPPSPTNQSPTVNAGNDKSVNEGMKGELVGTGADSDGAIASFSWQQENGTAVTITDADMASASFTAPAVTVAESLIFRLTVTDNDGATASDTVAFAVIDISAHWDAFVASLDMRISTEWMQLEADQTAARANAGSSFNDPEYLVSARNRFIIHINAFFDFAENEITRLANEGIFFPRNDIVAALSNSRSAWESLLNDFLVGSYFIPGWPTSNLDGIIRVEVMWQIDFTYSWFIDRMDASAAGPWEELQVSLFYGFILETKALEEEQRRNKGPTSGATLAAARNRFIGYVNSSFDFIYDETIRLTNNGNSFSRDDVIVLLDSHGEKWKTFLDWYLTSSGLFGGYGTNDFDTIFIPNVLTAIEAAIIDTLSRLDASGRLM